MNSLDKQVSAGPNDEIPSFSSPLTRMASEAVKKGYLSSYMYSIITKYPLFSLMLGQRTSLRFTIAFEIYRTIKYPWYTIKRLSSKLTGRNPHVMVGKNIMEVPEDMFVYFLTGDYCEKTVSHWIEKILLSTNNKVFYDIGANYGYYCLKFSAYASHVYAFEPTSRTSDILLKNIRRNNLENITVHKLGLSDKQSSMEINLYSSSGHNSLFLRDLPRDDPVKLVGQEVVSLVPLDDLIQDKKLNPPDLIKIDIEGGELYALRGARETIKKYQPALIIEYSESTFKDAGYSKSDLLAELMGSDYIIFGIPDNVEDSNVYSLERFDDIGISTIIALPKGMEFIVQ
jgi:FkbM family methyltransferase